MKILILHSDLVEVEPKKKAIKDAEEIEQKKQHMDECLVVFTAVEKKDEGNEEEMVGKLVNEVQKLATELKVENVMLYPYVHLTSEPSNPKTALNVLKNAENILKEKYNVERAPFGWYKAFTVKCKGHPLSELSRELSPGEKVKKFFDKPFEFHNESVTEEEKYNLSVAAMVGKAVSDLYKEAEVGSIGLHGDRAYVDIAKVKLNEETLPKIKKQVKKIIGKILKFEKVEAKDVNQRLQKEILKDVGDVDVYKVGDLEVVPLYKDAFVKSTKDVAKFELLGLGSAYWKNNADNEQLTRIYCVGFKTSQEHENFMKRLEDALARDHNKLGRELGLYMTSDLIGQGLPLFTPKGTKLFQILQRFVEDEEEKRGYLLTKTPFMAKSELYKVSGHWDHYRDGMFIVKDGNDVMALRPMTCPFQFQIYNSKLRSYKELPIRYNETSTLFRREESGEMHGLIRLRQFTISEGHLICRMDQLEQEFFAVLDLINYIFKTLGLKDYWYRFSRWDPENNNGKYIDNPKAWDESEKILKRILDKTGVKYTEEKGEAAFYGPKLDIQMKNVYGKEDTVVTVQIDFALPERFNMTYVNKEGKEERPIVIHRTSIGCYERTIAQLIEHYAGKFPLWLSPVQVKLLNVNDDVLGYLKEVEKELKENNIRVEVDDRQKTISKKVRDAQIEKVNYIVIIGQKEVDEKKIAVRDRTGKIEYGVS
ncbi:threonine--tRNA ligase, partial [Candidatus Woesearchaeota archaeon]